jgi:hypothetical protein
VALVSGRVGVIGGCKSIEESGGAALQHFAAVTALVRAALLAFNKAAIS